MSVFLLLNLLPTSHAQLNNLTSVCIFFFVILSCTALCDVIYHIIFFQNSASLSEFWAQGSHIWNTKTRSRIAKWMPWEKTLIKLSCQGVKAHHYLALNFLELFSSEIIQKTNVLVFLFVWWVDINNSGPCLETFSRCFWTLHPDMIASMMAFSVHLFLHFLHMDLIHICEFLQCRGRIYFVYI